MLACCRLYFWKRRRGVTTVSEPAFATHCAFCNIFLKSTKPSTIHVASFSKSTKVWQMLADFAEVSPKFLILEPMFPICLTAERCRSAQVRILPSKIGLDTAENEPSKT